MYIIEFRSLGTLVYRPKIVKPVIKVQVFSGITNRGLREGFLSLSAIEDIAGIDSIAYWAAVEQMFKDKDMDKVLEECLFIEHNYLGNEKVYFYYLLKREG